MAANQFSILTQSEFKLLFLTKMNMPSGSKVIVNTTNTTNTTANTTRKLQTVQIDWSKVNGVSSVRNQGQCGSCWAFTAAATLQSFSLIYKKQNIDLSEQQLVDCSISFGNSGCNGGWPSNALKYVQAYGLTTQSTYPYYGYLRRCSKIGGTFKISKIVYANGCQGLMTNLALNPIGVAVDATYWQYYGSGIFNYCNNYVNHAVLLVGVVSGNWKIKNSWGATWGQNGYIRLAPGNTCGICDYSGSFPQ